MSTDRDHQSESKFPDRSPRPAAAVRNEAAMSISTDRQPLYTGCRTIYRKRNDFHQRRQPHHRSNVILLTTRFPAPDMTQK